MSRPSRVWLHIFAGLCASLVGIGLARFAYTPLIPPLIDARWFAPSDVVYLGAANLAGYLVGALVGRPIGARLSNAPALRLMMALCSAAFIACAFPLSVPWYFGWRFVSGIAGGAIMVLVAATVLPHVPAGRKGLASGAIFVGVGLGVTCSGTLVPFLLQWGLRETWIGLGVFSALLTVASWRGWPPADRSNAEPVSASSASSIAATLNAAAQSPAAVGARGAIGAVGASGDVGTPGAARRRLTPLRILYIQYGLMAVGLVPGMVFIVDYIARGLGAGPHVGALFWVLYGVGAILGPPLYGFAADRLGSRSALRLLLAVQLLTLLGAIAVPVNAVLALLTVIIGTFPPGIAPLVLARVRDVAPGIASRQDLLWSRLTMVFAAAQALGAYGYSAIFNAAAGQHRLLFEIATAAIALALALDWVLRRSPAPVPAR